MFGAEKVPEADWKKIIEDMDKNGDEQVVK